MAIKYIANDTDIIMFSDTLVHSDVAQLLSSKLGEIKGAGFVGGFGTGNIKDIKTYGESYSLDIESREEDAEKIHKLLN